MFKTRHVAVVIVLALAAAGGARETGTEPRDASADNLRFVRVAAAADGSPRALQVAIVTYAAKSGDGNLTVDLVSAIHVGDRSYYHDLNERFATYDAVLYELIAAKDRSRPPQGAEPAGIVSNGQVLLKDILDLTFQLDEIDYGRKNFFHADFSPEELSRDMEQRGESLYAYFWRLFFVAFSQSASDPLGIRELRKLSQAANSEGDNKFKIALAFEFENHGQISDFLAGENGSALIEGRNQQAMAVLREQVRSGARRIAIFYGAGHMPDFHARMQNELGLERKDTHWVDAWDLR